MLNRLGQWAYHIISILGLDLLVIGFGIYFSVDSFFDDPLCFIMFGFKYPSVLLIGFNDCACSGLADVVFGSSLIESFTIFLNFCNKALPGFIGNFLIFPLF